MKEWQKRFFMILVYLSAVGYGIFMSYLAVIDPELNHVSKVVIVSYTLLGIIASSVIVSKSLRLFSFDRDDT